ncbi:MAG: DASS family sodium-coupled anion symporter [Longimicrobiales bacterium]|nr:DASS family sodium-coupled anion symporter [Longimicrobiales bacterium]
MSDGATSSNDSLGRVQWLGLLGGAAVFLSMVMLPTPGGLSPEGWSTAATATLMAVWWMTEAIPIPATALVPLVFFPALGVLDMSSAAAPYANELIFLFMGGFFIAFAMERWGLHRRIALKIMMAVGTSPRQLILGFMLATAFLSMWISNTATAAMMFPIGIAVGEMFRPADTEGRYEFGIALMLGIAYGASIGGVATLIGTPPNAVLAGAASEMLEIQIGFVEWMAVGLPIAAVLIPVAWLMLTRVLFPTGEVAGDAGELLQREKEEMGSPSRGEWTVGIVFAATALAWIFRAPKSFGDFTIPGIQSIAPAVGDATIAIGGALLLFLLPVDRKRGVFALDWETARKIPWGVLVLFGGGLSLARAMDQSGLAAWIGSGVGALGGIPTVVIFATVAALFVFLTEVTSNTATSTMAMPIMAGVAAGLGMAPLTLMTVAALSASMAFMLPVATPPNAIVFGSEYLSIPEMARAGFWMNLISIASITVAATLLIPFLLR